MPDGRGMGEVPLPEWSASDRVPARHTIDHGVLSWHPRGRDYSIRWFFRPDGDFFRWYANLEAPPPFDGTWRDFRPDPSWAALPRELPHGWDRVET
ncbi:DUF402 domain-containing protein [Actinoplanes philippinensis]|uniref:DUF402 domain-containing protein n=1 Tax=Actinoplanes philippinensis TaxID=35752 RepID=UPI0033E00307